MAKHGRRKSMERFPRRGNIVPGLPRPKILIACEGEKTEPNYFNAIRRHFRVQPELWVVIPECGVPRTVVKRAKEEKKRAESAKEEPYDEIWVVLIAMLSSISKTRSRWLAPIILISRFPTQISNFGICCILEIRPPSSTVKMPSMICANIFQNTKKERQVYTGSISVIAKMKL